jgi:hypothetical protein
VIIEEVNLQEAVKLVVALEGVTGYVDHGSYSSFTVDGKYEVAWYRYRDKRLYVRETVDHWGYNSDEIIRPIQGLLE